MFLASIIPTPYDLTSLSGFPEYNNDCLQLNEIHADQISMFDTNSVVQAYLPAFLKVFEPTVLIQ